MKRIVQSPASWSFALVWAAGAFVQIGAERGLLAGLPAPSGETLLRELLAASTRLLPAAAAIALLIALVTRGREPMERIHPLSAFAGTVLLLLPTAVVTKVASAPFPWLLLLAAGAPLLLAVALDRGRSRSMVPLLLLAPGWLTAVGGLLPAPPPPGRPLAEADGYRVVLVGWDGADWSVMDPLLEAGELPAIERIRRAGVSGPLRSLEPTLSNRVWTSAATGVVPERHGITDFFFDRRAIRVPTMWELVDAQAGRVGLFEYLVTEPPLPFQGFVLPGWMAYNPTDTHPPGLSRRLRFYSAVSRPYETIRYLFHRNGDKRAGHRARFEVGQVGAAFLALHERYRPDLAACIWYGTDRLGHQLWRYHEPEAFDEPLPEGGDAFRSTLVDVYRRLDEELDLVLRRLDDDRTLFVVMSDHGMGPMESVEVTGYTRGLRALDALGLDEDFYVESPHSELFINGRVEGRSDPWTIAAADHRASVEQAADRFRSVRLADGSPLFEVEVGDLELVDLKVRVPRAESLSPTTPIFIDGSEQPTGSIVQLVEVSGTHRIDGILVMTGAGVREGARIDDAIITDVAPTILYALGLPVAEDLDGKILSAAFTDGWRHRRPVKTVPTFGSKDAPAEVANPPDEALIEKLRSLGYIK